MGAVSLKNPSAIEVSVRVDAANDQADGFESCP
jgi:hypothetical protein